MTLNNLMAQLARLRIVVRTDGHGQLSISAPKGAMTEALKQELRRFKHEIVVLLEKGQHGAVEQLRFAENENENERYAPFPLSDLQMAFSMADDPYMEFHVRPHYYCESDVNGLDVGRYEAALNQAVARHRGEIVLLVGEQRLAALREVAAVRCKVNDLRALAPDEARTQLLALRERLSREELPLDRWPWFDCQVSRWLEGGREMCRIHMNHNNFYTDGFGAMVLQRDIQRFYDDPQAQLPPITLTYRDAVLGLEKLGESAAGTRAKQYWQGRLADLPEPPPLPLVPGMDRRRRSRLQRRENFLAPVAWAAFKGHASRAGLTPTTAIIAAYAEILCAWSGSRHFVLSNMVTRRLPLHPDIGNIVGNFASLYPLEVDLRGALTFAQRAARLQAQILTDSSHREWGGMQVMQALNRLKGALGRVPCPFVVGSGLFAEGYAKPDFGCLETAQTMLDHQFWELDDGRYYYVWDLLEEYFPAGMIDQMWHAFDRLLQRLAQDEAYWEATTLDLAPPVPSLASCTNEAATSPLPLLHDGLARTAAIDPERILLITPHDRMRYADAERASTSVMRSLAGFDVQPGELVAVVLDRGAALLAATLGILRAGAAYVPIDPALPPERLRYMLEDSKARVVLTSAAGRAMLTDLAGIGDAVRIVTVDAAGAADLLDVSATALPAHDAAATDLAYVIYTSGSTGSPKGVVIEHGAALNTVADINRRFGVGAADRLFGVSSFSFDLSVYDIFGALEAGAMLVYPAPEGALNPAHWIDVLAAERVTVWNSAPPLMSLLVETALRQQVSLPDLRLVMLSGDWIPLDLPDAVRRIAPNATIVSLGGATEASIWSIFYEIDQVRPEWSSIPYGYPLSGQVWRIRDSLGRPSPVWTPGELLIGGQGLARGYWGDADKTLRAFVTDPVSGERLYHTGDIGRYLPDGSIEFLGRSDSQVKIQGHRIELGEIEAVLGAHPLVKDAVVLARGSGETPSRERMIVACITLVGEAQDDDHAAIITTVRTALQARLPAYMLPAAWLVLPALPITSNGKIDRAALARIEVRGEPAAERRVPVAPRTRLEQRMAALWGEVLATETAGVHDDFFSAGGQSFDAVRLVARIKEQFGVTLRLSDVWQERTVEKLALRIQLAGSGEQEVNLIALNADKPGTPYFFIHPGGGQVHSYYDLSDRLLRPSFAFAVTAADIEARRLASVEEMAARYLAQLVAIQPHGPYWIAGWSSGGCIAFELALQLEQRGERVASLVVIDCPSPLAQGLIARTEIARNFFSDLDVDFPTALSDALDPDDLFNEDRFAAVIERFNAGGAILLDPSQLLPVFRAFTAIVDATRAYRPAGLVDANILLLRATEGEVAEFADHPHACEADWGWSAMTNGALCHRAIAANHYTLLKPPALVQLAQAVIGNE
jgi:pyochelin synthetase